MKAKPIDIEEIFRASTRVLEAKLSSIRAAFHHGGMKGAAVEASIKHLLEEILPGNLAVGSGIIIDAELNASRQVDIVIYDRASTPTFFSTDGLSLFPVECVYFAIEVKTVLDSKAFSQCEENMDSVKSLRRTAYYPNIGEFSTTFSQYRGLPETSHWETIFLVVAIEAPSKISVLKLFENHRETTRPINKQIDSIYVANTGCFSNHRLVPPRHTGASILPSNDSIIGLNETDGLLTFLSYFSAMYNQAQIGGRFDFTRYVTLPVDAEYYIETERTKTIIKNAYQNGYEFRLQEGSPSGLKVKPTLDQG